MSTTTDYPASERGESTASPPPAGRARTGAVIDRLFGLVARGAALVTLGLLVGILLSLVVGAMPAIP
jgi:phosphate transport system permease protein